MNKDSRKQTKMILQLASVLIMIKYVELDSKFYIATNYNFTHAMFGCDQSSLVPYVSFSSCGAQCKDSCLGFSFIDDICLLCKVSSPETWTLSLHSTEDSFILDYILDDIHTLRGKFT